MGCCTLSSCSSTKLGTKDAGTHNPIDQGVDNKNIYTVHDDLKLLQRWSPAGQLIFLLKLLLLVAVSTKLDYATAAKTTAKQGIRDKIKFNSLAQQFNFRIIFHFLNFKKKLLHSFQNLLNLFPALEKGG